MKRVLVGLLFLTGLLAFAIWLFRTPDADIAKLEAAYGAAPSQFMTLPTGERVHFRDQGNNTGKVLLLLHGTSSSLHTWQPWIERLGDDYRIITLDLPGHGLTGPVANCDYSVSCSINLVENFRSALGFNSFVIGGNSFGGNVAWRYTLEHPSFVEALILSDASGGPNINPAPLTPAFVLASIPIANLLIEVIAPRFMIEQGLKDATEIDEAVTEERVDRYWQLGLRPGNRRALRLRMTAPRNGPLFHEALAKLQIPTLILWGREDRFVDMADGEWFARTIPGAKLAIYDGVGHLPMIEAPDLSAIDVREFLQSLPEEETTIAPEAGTKLEPEPEPETEKPVLESNTDTG